MRPGTLCASCWPRIRFLERPWCEILGTPFAHDMGEGAVSPEAIANPPPFARARAAVSYTGAARQIVQNLKYRDRTDLAPWMAAWMLRAGAELVRDAELVLPVPLHRRRFFWRRFNQSAELARHVALRASLPFAAGAVERSKRTRQQVGLGAKEREDNVRGAFRVVDAAAVRGRRVLVIDDVITTGATVSALTKALKRSGAREVDVLAFARAIPGDFAGDFLPGGAASI
jgi:ComF family protein